MLNQPPEHKNLNSNLILPCEDTKETGTSPFKINIAQDILDDLNHRLKNTCWPDEIANSR
jgi:hypothetical protein